MFSEASESRPNQGQSEYKKELAAAFSGTEGFIGITAIHGIEPFLIVTETARAINDELEAAGLPRRPIILPKTPGYEKQLDRVLPDEYGDTPQRSKVLDDIYFSSELGEILATTEFNMAGYQPHLENVARLQPKTQEKLWRFLDGGFKAVSFTNGQELQVSPRGRLVEINAGANVSASRDNEKSAYSVFPNTFDALLRFIQEHNDEEVFDYREGLLNDNLDLANKLRDQFRLVFIPFLHPLLEEPRLTEELYPDAVYFPPLKDIQTPPTDITFDFEGNQIYLNSDGKETQTFGFNPEKGAVYVNISGGGMGLSESYSAAYSINKAGYAVFAPSWIIRGWIDAKLDASFVIPSGPRVLYAKDKEGKPVFKGILMRSGKGITDRAELSETPMVLNTFTRGDNPEIWGNDRAILSNNLGRRFSSRRDLMDLVDGGNHSDAIRNFERHNRQRYDISSEISGPKFVARKIIEAEIAASKK